MGFCSITIAATHVEQKKHKQINKQTVILKFLMKLNNRLYCVFLYVPLMSINRCFFFHIFNLIKMFSIFFHFSLSRAIFITVIIFIMTFIEFDLVKLCKIKKEINKISSTINNITIIKKTQELSLFVVCVRACDICGQFQ